MMTMTMGPAGSNGTISFAKLSPKFWKGTGTQETMSAATSE